MELPSIKQQLQDYAKDIKLNMSSVICEDGAPDLSQNQIYAIALTSAYATKQTQVIDSVYGEAKDILSADEINAAKAAATLMAMNNVYYRFVHLVNDKEYATLPARLRMNIIGKSGIEKTDFELYSLAVSAINGCGMCIDAHVHELTQAGISKTGIHSTIRIAAVINAMGQAIAIENNHSAS